MFENCSEIAIEWVKGQDTCTVSAYSSSKIKNKLIKLTKSHPDDVQIICENTDGSIVAHIPIKYVKISPPKKVSEEQREKLRQRMCKSKHSL